MRIALYARISKALDQNVENQLIALREWASKSRVEIEGEYVDEVSSKDTRPQKEAVLRKLRLNEIDGVVFWSLDRWGRTMSELVIELEEFSKSGKALISIKEGIDLSNAAGRLMANVLAAMANFERDMIHERTMLGLARARSQGKKLGRPRKYAYDATWCERMTEEQKQHHSVRKAARDANIKSDKCEKCGSTENLVCHHPDYSKPLLIQTLCQNCHYEVHRKGGAANPTSPIEDSIAKLKNARFSDASEAQRSYPKEWLYLRSTHISLCGHKCAKCGIIYETDFLEMDHIIPIADGGIAFDESNIQILCLECHTKKSAKESHVRNTKYAQEKAKLGLVT